VQKRKIQTQTKNFRVARVRHFFRVQLKFAFKNTADSVWIFKFVDFNGVTNMGMRV